MRPLVSRVRTTDSAAKGASGASYWTDEPLTDALLAEHLAGGRPRGACPMDIGSTTTRLAVFDLDSHKGATSFNDMILAAQHVCDALEARQLAPIVWRSSGGRGIHIFLLWERPQHAYSVRVLLGQVLADCGFTSGAKGVAQGQIEVFPKQDEIRPGERGNQFILPLAGLSVPIDMLLGVAMTREDALELAWPMSADVPLLTAPVRLPTAVGDDSPDPISKVIEALGFVPNDGLLGDLDYEAWHRIVCAVHEATGGSQEGLDAVQEWSASNPRHDSKFLRDRVWPYIKSAGERGSAIRRGTLYAAARDAGWLTPPTPDAEGFEDVPLPPGQAGVEPDAEDEGDDCASLFAEDGEPTAASGSSGMPGGVQQSAPSGTLLPALVGPDDGSLPGFQRASNGEIFPIARNLLPALARPDVCGLRIGYDNFRDEIMSAAPGTDDWRPFRDADYVFLRVMLETGGIGFKPLAKDLLRETVAAVAEAYSFDSAILWVSKLQWDGVPRIDTFFSRYFRLKDSEYHTAVARYVWSAHAGRALVPGIKADMGVILTGIQGQAKSGAIAAMVPDRSLFCEIAFNESDENLARKMRGKLVVEVPELRGLHTRDNEGIKSFMTRPREQWTPKYKEFTTEYGRRSIIWGTSNEDEIFADKTGNRRWLPIKCGPEIDFAGIAADCHQLWAEAAVLFNASGIQWRDAQRLAADIHSDFAVTDVWTDEINAWLDAEDIDGSKNSDRKFLTTHMMLIQCIRMELSRITRKDELRMAGLLRTLKFDRRKVWVNNRAIWGFVRQD